MDPGSLPANQARLTLTVNGDPLPVVALHGEEHLSRPFTFTVEALLDKYLQPDRLLGARAVLAMTGHDGLHRQVAGILSQFEDVGHHPDGRVRAALTLDSALVRLHQQRDTRVILGQTVPDIVRATCERHGLSAAQLRFDLSRAYGVHPYMVQANETDLAFIQRLLGRAGIYFYSVAEDDSEIIVFTDHNTHCPYLGREVLEFRPPTGLPETVNGNAHVGLHALRVHHRLLPATHGAQDVNEDTPDVALRCDTDCDAPGAQYHATRVLKHGLGSRAMEHTERISRQLAEHARVQASELVAQGNVVDMAAGHVFSLEASQFDARHSGDWLITGVTHSASQRAGQGGSGEDVAYRHTATCIERSVPYRPAVPAHPELPTTFSARIESDGPYARLDEQGRYQLRCLFDASLTEQTRASIPMRRLQPLGGPPAPDGKTVGLHTPLQDGDEVVLSCLNGDPDRPMLVGSTPNPERPSPVTALNPAQNRLRTMSDNELCLDDAKEKECITLRTFAGYTILQLNADAVEQQVRLATEHGAMAQWAKKTIAMQSGESLSERVGNDRTQIIENKHQTTTNNNEIHQQAKTDHKHTAHEFFKTTSGKNTEVFSGKHVKIAANDNATLTIRGADGFHATVRGGHVTVNAAKAIRITGKGGGDITFEQAGGGFKVKANGDVELYGKQVSLGGPSGVTFNGPVSYSIGAPSIPGAAGVAAPLAAEPIANLKDDSDAQVIDLIWQDEIVPYGSDATLMYTAKNFEGDEAVTIQIYEKNSDGQKTLIDTLQSRLDDGTGHYQHVWQRSEEQIDQDLLDDQNQNDRDPLSYIFDVTVNGETSRLSAPLHLSSTVEFEPVYPDGSPVPDDIKIVLIDALQTQHRANVKDGTAIFKDIILGPMSFDIAGDPVKTESS